MRRFMLGMAGAALIALQPFGVLADDQQQASQIAQALKASGRLKNYNIKVKFENGAAWLTGRVTNEEQMADAIAVAEQTEGVKSVVNQLAIQSEAAPVEGAVVRRATRPELQFTAESNQPATVQQAFYPESAEQEQVSQPARLKAPQQTAPVRRATKSVPLGRKVSQSNVNTKMTPNNRQIRQTAMRGQPETIVEGAYEPTPANAGYYGGQPIGMRTPNHMIGAPAGTYDQPHMPNHAWPAYAAYPNYAAVTYPQQYSPTAWPFIGPFYPYPQVPLGWRKVTLEWDDGWWFLDFNDKECH